MGGAALASAAKPVVIGGSGFIGATICRLSGADSVGRADLSAARTEPAAAARLRAAFDGRLIIIAASETPVPEPHGEAWQRNLAMLDGLLASEPAWCVYLSSEAVYPFARDLDERIAPAPDSAYGAMHLARERRLADRFGDRLSILRLCQIYGAGDRHNAYGPMRMIRSALLDGEVTLFGGGEETRHHLHVEDAAAAILTVAARRHAGICSIGSADTVSFAQVADLVSQATGARIMQAPRRQDVTHRSMNDALLRALAPSLRRRALRDGLMQTLETESAGV